MTVQLVDISNHQGPVNWTKVASFASGAWLKATEGITYIDPYFESHRAACKAVGVHSGAYHFARPDKNPGAGGAVAEADWFCDTVGLLSITDLRPALDFETRGSEMETWARTFNAQVRYRLGTIPLFYTYRYFIIEAAFSSPIGNGLWLADYGINDGNDNGYVVPAPWKKVVAHQYTSRARVPGVKNLCDADVAESIKFVANKPLEIDPYVEAYTVRRAESQTEF